MAFMPKRQRRRRGASTMFPGVMSSNSSQTSAQQTWVIILAGGFILALSMGLRQTFGLFLGPMTADLAIGRGDFSLTLAVQNLMWGIVTPFLGALADRFGTARFVALGGLCYLVGLALMAVGDDLAALWLSSAVLVGLGISGAGFSLVLAAVARASRPERRSLNLGLASAGGSVGMFVLVPASQVMIEAFDWRDTLWVMAALACLVVPLAFFLKGRPAQVGGQSFRAALAEAGKHSGFRLLIAGFFVCGFQLAFIGVHLPGYVVSCNLDPSVGAEALGIVGFFNIIGVLLAGVLGGRYRKKYILSSIYLTRAAAMAILLVAPKSQEGMWVFAAVMGLLWLSTVPLTSALVEQIFGPRYLATLVAIVMLSHQVGSFFGAWLGGLVYDANGNYDLVWYISILLGVFAALVHAPIADRSLRVQVA